jgi:chemotaxis protein methyltransferase CheR
MSISLTGRETPLLRHTPPLLSPEQFERLRGALAAFGGIFLDASQQRMLEYGLASRTAATGLPLERYEQLVLAGADRDEIRRLAELLLNHETFFFRNQPHVRALRQVLLPEIHRRKPPGEPIRIWSAGCSTGEEPYSIALAALETLAYTGRRAEVYGTDLSEIALEKARAGVYRGRTLNNVAPAQLMRFFEPAGDSYRVGAALRAAVRFERLNLLDPFPDLVRGSDVIFCQNVTIYFQAEARRALIERFYETLPPHGLLLLGFSETLWNVFDGFQAREVDGAYVYVKAAPAPAPAPPRDRSARVRLHVPPAAARRERIPQRDPEPAPAPPAAPTLLAARALADRGEHDAAEEELRRIIAVDALNEEAYLLLGVIHGRRGEWHAAVRELERARYLQPSDPLVSFHLADAYRHTLRVSQALREYQVALRKLEPLAPETLVGGVAVSWLRETCERQLAMLRRHGGRR